MPRGSRCAPGGLIYHVLNRANGRRRIFDTEKDFQAFVQCAAEALILAPIRVLAYCVLSNHWHFVLWPRYDGQLSKFLHQMTTTHVRRWHKFRNTEGTGHVYQGPFKSFPVQDDDHFYTVCRYVERNAVRAGLTSRVEDWTWCSEWARRHDSDCRALPLAAWPLPRPDAWSAWVNRPLREAELRDLRTCARRGGPFGDADWRRETARRLGIEHTQRAPGRPAAAI